MNELCVSTLYTVHCTVYSVQSRRLEFTIRRILYYNVHYAEYIHRGSRYLFESFMYSADDICESGGDY